MCYYQRLKDLREDKELKQIDIARLLETTQQQYSKYETGMQEMPTRHVSKLADFYNTSTDYILGRTSDIKPYPQKNACKQGLPGLPRRPAGGSQWRGRGFDTGWRRGGVPPRLHESRLGEALPLRRNWAQTRPRLVKNELYSCNACAKRTTSDCAKTIKKDPFQGKQMGILLIVFL